MKVLIVDGDALSRERLRSALSTSDDVEVVGECDSGEEAVWLVQDLGPDVVVMDIGLPGINGTEATRQMLALAPDTKIILFTVEMPRAPLSDALEARASAFPALSRHEAEVIEMPGNASPEEIERSVDMARRILVQTQLQRPKDDRLRVLEIEPASSQAIDRYSHSREPT
jgi:DNA-binding NarL/FixJ family response regulator